MRSVQRRPLPGLAPILVLLLAAGCARPEPTVEQPAAAQEEAAAPEHVTGTATAADGVPIAYQSWGSGDTAVVFVHCWACNRGFWRHQVEPVAEAGYRAVALDLPGHGESGAERTDWTLAGLAADVGGVIEELGLERVILVGHSMGGPVSLETAPLLPGTVIGIACVDTLHDVEFEWPEGMVEQMAAQLEADYRAGMENFVPGLFRADADPAVVEWVIDQAVETTEPHATIALMRHFPTWDPPGSLAAAGVPVRCINAAPEGERGLPTAVETNRKYADFDAVLIEGVGHYPQLERPEEFNRHLLAALGELSAPQGELESPEG